MSPLQSGVSHSFQFTFIMHNLPIPHPACMGWERIRKGERERERDVSSRPGHRILFFSAHCRLNVLWFPLFHIYDRGGGEVGGARAHKFSWPVVTVKSRAASCLASYRVVPWFSRGEHDCLAVFKGSAEE